MCIRDRGGDEFLVLLTPCEADDLMSIATRLRLEIARQASYSEGNVTVSVGACLVQPGETLESALQRADDALYNAKESGRDRLVVA